MNAQPVAIRPTFDGDAAPCERHGEPIATVAPSPRMPVTVEFTGEALTIRTGAAAFDVPLSGALLIADARVDGISLLAGAALDAADADGHRYHLAIRCVRIERSGAVTAVVRLDAELVGVDGRPWLDASARLQFFAGLGTVRVEVSVTNPRAASHPGGTCDHGDRGSVLIGDLSATITARRPAGAGRFAIAILPRQHAGGYQLQGGEGTTFSFVLCCGPDSVSAAPLAWTRSLVRVAADAESYRAAGKCLPAPRLPVVERALFEPQRQRLVRRFVLAGAALSAAAVVAIVLLIS